MALTCILQNKDLFIFNVLILKKSEIKTLSHKNIHEDCLLFMGPMLQDMS